MGHVEAGITLCVARMKSWVYDSPNEWWSHLLGFPDVHATSHGDSDRRRD